MVNVLTELKKHYGVVEVKAEFEAEASRLCEIMRLKEIVERVGLGLVLKIGGPEAITDMFESQHIGVSGLVAPMVESAYALEKFLQAVITHYPEDLRKTILFGVNIETIQAYHNIHDILNVKLMKILGKITLGRVDLSGSLGLSRDQINCDQIYKIAEDIFIKAKKKGLKTAMGGGIALEAVPFIKKLSSKNLLDYFETRKVVFKVPKSFQKLGDGIIKANTFELLWLENKKNYYSRIFLEDDKRIQMLKKRVKNSNV
ncbi:MAG: aldolase/citrate lyase family protein [Bacteroidota bacterium]